MGKRFDEITPELQHFMEAQHVFFVGSAPRVSEGHVNVSPKGLDTFRVLGPKQVVYLDLTGSGNETAAHLTENERLTVMFCAFSGAPRILRLYCHGRVVTREGIEWSGLAAQFSSHVGVRQFIVGELEYVQTSCGYAVPELTFAGERETLTRWGENKGEQGLATYRRTHNAESIDGLPAPPTDP